MKLALAVVMVAGTAAQADADVFVFRDLDGFEKCMQTDHLVESEKTAGGEQARFLSQVEIQLRCIESAVKLLAPATDKKLMMSFIDSAKRLTAPENSVDLINVLIGKQLPACNDMPVYEVLTRTLSHPKETSARSNWAKARLVVKRCLKDAQYRKDFLEEKDSGNSYLSTNACEILLEEKLVKSCPQKK